MAANGKSEDISQDFLEWVTGAAMPTAPTALYVGLLSTIPASNATTASDLSSIEITDLTRQLVTFGTISDNGSEGKQMLNNIDVAIQNNTGGTLSVSGWVLCNHVSNTAVGDYIYWSELDDAQKTSVEDQNTLRFPSTKLIVIER
jgi:hypothetical protein